VIQSHRARLAISDAQCQRTSNGDAYYRFSMRTSLQEWSDVCHGGMWSSSHERLLYQWHIPRAESTARNVIIYIPEIRRRNNLQNCCRKTAYGFEVHLSSMTSRFWRRNFM
jgi:hypothetical protein